jgi:hypothetical protein
VERNTKLAQLVKDMIGGLIVVFWIDSKMTHTVISS